MPPTLPLLSSTLPALDHHTPRYKEELQLNEKNGRAGVSHGVSDSRGGIGCGAAFDLEDDVSAGVDGDANSHQDEHAAHYIQLHAKALQQPNNPHLKPPLSRISDPSFFAQKNSLLCSAVWILQTSMEKTAKQMTAVARKVGSRALRPPRIPNSLASNIDVTAATDTIARPSVCSIVGT